MPVRYRDLVRDERGNSLTRLRVTPFVMDTFARHTLRVIFLAVYIPLSVSIGMLHNDDLRGGAGGPHTLRAASTPAHGRLIDDGFCLACLFTAGHAIHHAPVIPVLSPDRAPGFDNVAAYPESFRQARSARAPPLHPLR